MSGATARGLAFLGLGLVASACGYQPANTANDALAPFEVAPDAVVVPDAAAAEAAVSGARAELARRGVLGGCSAAPSARCTEVRVAVTRIEESPVGIGVGRTGGAADTDAAPLARGVRITVTGSARVVVEGEPRRATGEASASEIVSVGGGVAAATLARDDAARAAATRLGVRLARLLLGHPEPTRD